MAANIDIYEINVINKTNNMKMETTIKIIPPEGYEFDKEKSTFEEMVFKKIENDLPMSWKELGIIKGYYILSNSNIDNVSMTNAIDVNRNLFPSKKEAEAMVAMAQLCQLRDRWNGGWKPDWENYDELKYCIFSCYGKLEKSTLRGINNPMCFKTQILRNAFMVVFKDLLETAKPFL